MLTEIRLKSVFYMTTLISVVESSYVATELHASKV